MDKLKLFERILAVASKMKEFEGYIKWNPILDSCIAFDLAVENHIVIQSFAGNDEIGVFSSAYNQKTKEMVDVYHQNDKQTATRLAVVIALIGIDSIKEHLSNEELKCIGVIIEK